jgi:hypothetical protein
MNANESRAAQWMMGFAERTGLTSDKPGRRYLWTDAFAVCNFLGLARATGKIAYEELALRLVDRVHYELGRHREDEPRGGWLSGLPDAEARAHPTRGGLRIGKALPERRANEPFDPELEWERDGQYFHYLTQWMHALDQVTRYTGEPRFNLWARELAVIAHRRFVHGPPGARRMFWKMSIDLSRALLPSMGQHDPLDGFVACSQLEATASALPSASGPDLRAAMADFAQMIDRDRLATTDPLGLGGILVDACRLAQVETNSELLPRLLDAAAVSLRIYSSQPDLRARAEHRLAFRELGLSLGLGGVATEQGVLAFHLDAQRRGEDSLAELLQSVPLRTEIESFWLDPEHRRASTWLEHLDINEVMLATSLAPEGFVELPAIHRDAISEKRRPWAST